MKLTPVRNRILFYGLLSLQLILAFSASSQTYRVSRAVITVEGTAREKAWSMKSQTAEGSARLLFRNDKLKEVSALNLSIPVGELKSENAAMDQRAYKALKRYPYDQIRFSGKIMELTETGADTYLLSAEGNLQIAGITRVVTMMVDVRVNGDGTLIGTGTKEIKRSDFDIRLLPAEERLMTLSDRLRVNFQLTLLK
jgi:polyisoprenoid-binding protein YceI